MSSDYPPNALPINYKLGEYVIKSVLGYGGFGITYLATDSRLDSQVAIKEYFPNAFAIREQKSTIRPRTGSNTDDIENYRWGLQEFLKEARALAKFKHNHIVRVLRFLEANGTAYMVMEYEEGESFAKFLKRHGGFLNEALLLQVFLPVLSGLQAVHEAGLLHLDIKPDNIYLRTNGQPMLIDFGSVQQTKRDSGGDQKVALTPCYSALEQYPGKGEQGPWSDVYSMGATLYRCVTGQEPIDSLKRYKAIRDRGVDILMPATEYTRPFYSKHIRECIDKALAMDKEDRPQSAAALQNGLMGKSMAEARSKVNYQTGSGFIGVVRKADANQKLSKYMKRSFLEKLIVFIVFIAAIAIVTPKLLVGTFVISEAELYEEIDNLKSKAAMVKSEARRGFEKHVFGKYVDDPATSESVAMAAPAPKAKPKKQLDFSTSKSVVFVLSGHSQSIHSLAFVADDTKLVSASADGEIKIWDIATGKLQETLQASPDAAGAIAASLDGRWLAIPGDEHIIRLLDLTQQSPTGELLGHSQHINTMAFSPDGKLLASASKDKTVALWDVEKQTKISNLTELTDDVRALAFSPNGRMLVAGNSDGGIRYWDVSTTRELANTSAGDEAITTLAFSPDGYWLASGGEAGHLKLWDMGIAHNDRVLTGAPETVHTVCFSPDKKWLILSGSAESIQLWNVETGNIVHRLYGHNNNVQTVVVSHDGTYLASGSDDNTVRLWR